MEWLATYGDAIAGGLVVGVLGLVGIWLTDRYRVGGEKRGHEAEAARLIRKYRDPLAQSSFDLQSRLYNIVSHDFLGKYLVRGTAQEREYALESTLYIVAEYFGWVERLRREIRFLDLGDVAQNRQLSQLLNRISAIFLRELPDTTFRVFRAEQRALGDVIRGTDAASADGCIGYAAFVTRRSDPEFSRWFVKLAEDVQRLADEPGEHLVRIIELQHALVDLLDFVDRDRQYFPEQQRRKLTATASGDGATVTRSAASSPETVTRARTASGANGDVANPGNDPTPAGRR